MKRLVYKGPGSGAETPWGTFKKGEPKEVPDEHALDKALFAEEEPVQVKAEAVQPVVKKEAK